MGVRKKGKNYFIDYNAEPKRYKEMVGLNRWEAGFFRRRGKAAVTG
jgi:hypothetical protein